MGAYTKAVPTKLGQVRLIDGGPAPIQRLSVAASQTIKRGDLLTLNSSSKLLEQSVTDSALTTDGFSVRADTTGRMFVAQHDITTGASVTDDDRADVCELLQDTEVYLCAMNAPTTAAALGAATNTTETAMKVDTEYMVARYAPKVGNSYYGISIGAATAAAGLKVRSFSPEKLIADTYAFCWCTRPTAGGL